MMDLSLNLGRARILISMWQYFYFLSESFDDLAPKKRWICNQYQINFVEPNFYFSVPGRYFGHDDSSWYGCNRDRVDKVSFHSSGGGASNLHTESRCGSKPTRKQIYMGSFVSSFLQLLEHLYLDCSWNGKILLQSYWPFKTLFL